MGRAMSMSHEQDSTIQTYDRLVSSGHMPNGFEKYHPEGYWREEMAHFHWMLPKGRVLEIGPGGGHHAKELRALGYEYAAIEPSLKLLEETKANLPGVTIYQQSVEELSLPRETKYDGFWAAASLLHVKKHHMPLALRNIRQVLKPGGVGFISLIEGQGEGMRTEWFDENEAERFFALWEFGEFEEVLAANGFKWDSRSTREKGHWERWLEYWVVVA